MEFHIQELIDHNLRVMSRAESGVLARDLTPEEMLFSSLPNLENGRNIQEIGGMVWRVLFPRLL